MKNLKELSIQSLELARQAGAKTLPYFRSVNLKVTEKGQDSPLTAADLESNQVIVDGLAKMDSSIPIISEENAQIPYAQRKDWKLFWIVDPLDGTKEFIAGIPEFTVNIALIENGIPILGIVTAPALDLEYWATRSDGCYKNGERVYSRKQLDNRVALESRFHSKDIAPEMKSKYHIGSMDKVGSSLKFAKIAEGSADIYIRHNPIMEWDVAAGDALFRYSARDGVRKSPLIYNQETLKILSLVIGDDI